MNKSPFVEWMWWIVAITICLVMAIWLLPPRTPLQERTVIAAKAAEIARLEGEVEALRSIMDSGRTVTGAMIDEYTHKSGKLSRLKELQKSHPSQIITNHVLVCIVVDESSSRYQEVLSYCQTNAFDQVLTLK